jgi:hypothetical protein
VIPRAVVPPKDGPKRDVCVERTGDGVALIDPTEVAPTRSPSASAGPRTKPPSGISPVKAAPPPPPGAGDLGSGDHSSPAIELDVVKTADWLTDDESKDESSDETKRDEM